MIRIDCGILRKIESDASILKTTQRKTIILGRDKNIIILLKKRESQNILHYRAAAMNRKVSLFKKAREELDLNLNLNFYLARLKRGS